MPVLAVPEPERLHLGTRVGGNGVTAQEVLLGLHQHGTLPGREEIHIVVSDDPIIALLAPLIAGLANHVIITDGVTFHVVHALGNGIAVLVHRIEGRVNDIFHLACHRLLLHDQPQDVQQDALQVVGMLGLEEQVVSIIVEAGNLLQLVGAK